MRTSFLLLASCLAGLTMGCGSDHTASMQDNLGLTLDLNNTNVLHTPYVAGSHFAITLQAGPNATNDGWTLKSSDPTVMQVASSSENGPNEFPVVAAGAGHATLTVTDKSGNVIDSADVDVDVPTRIQLCEQGLLYAGYSDDQAALTSVQVVNGGTATFLARYFSGSQELYGNNALTATNTSIALASITSTSLSASDFVEITGTGTGSTTVPLAAGGTTLDVPVTVVDPTAVKKVAIAPQSESGASDKQLLHVFARAFDANGGDVYGSSFAWSIDGQAPSCCANSTDPSDLLVYQYHSSGTESVAAALDSQSASTTVHGTPSSTTVSSSQDVGCSVARGAGAGGSAAAFGTFLLGLVAVASRRLRSKRA